MIFDLNNHRDLHYYASTFITMPRCSLIFSLKGNIPLSLFAFKQKQNSFWFITLCLPFCLKLSNHNLSPILTILK
uniref:Putative ovule protein n=1 Tax=Solanum chacoense TaxID=4108 RepID=A0A0V0H0W3_SOLCH